MQVFDTQQQASGRMLTRAIAVSMVLLSTTALAAGTAPLRSAAAPLLVGRTDAARPIALSLSLPSRDPEGAAAMALHVSKPGDPLYRKYLTPDEYAARFGASQADYDALVAWARAQGLTVGEHYAARTVLPVSGPAASVEKAMGVTFSDYRDQSTGRTFYAADALPHLPDAIAAKLDGVIGLSGNAHFMPYLMRVPPGIATNESGTGPQGAFLASDLRTAYAVPTLAFGAKSQTLAVFEQGGFDPADVTTYLVRNNLPAVPVKARNVDGYGGGIDDAGVELEAVLDIDMQIGINPAAKQILVYEDGTDSFPVALLDSFAAMASDNVAKSISVSYGQDETLQGRAAIKAENTVLTQMAAQGQAVFASAGDDGAYGDFSNARPLNVSDPSSQPFVTGVGGTTLFTGKKEVYQAEEVWNDLGVGAGATGGGVSRVWPIPDYQVQFGQSVAVDNGGSSTRRNVPDVASLANPLTGVAVYSKLNGGWITLGGTSVSAPIWAGFYSLINTASEGLGFGVAGFANPGIYSVASKFGLLYPDLYDIADGSNGSKPLTGLAGFTAGPGYDNATGWGSFQGSDLLIDFALLPTDDNAYSPPPVNGIKVDVEPTTATITWTGAPIDVGFVVYVGNYNTGATVSATLQKSHTAKITGLLPNTTYFTEIVSVSKVGRKISVPDIFTTPKAGS